jgi:glyoxylase I family protein
MNTFLALHHVSVLVSDTERALLFYRDLLGLSLDESRPALDFPGAWLVVGNQQIHLIGIPQHRPGRWLPTAAGTGILPCRSAIWNRCVAGWRRVGWITR